MKESRETHCSSSQRRRPDPDRTTLAIEPPSEGDSAHSETDLHHDKHSLSVETYPSVAATAVGNDADRKKVGPRYSRLHARNEGRLDQDHSQRLSEMDKRRITQCICDDLGISDQQRDLSVRYMDALDLDQFGNQKKIEKVALAVIRHVVDSERMEQIRKDPKKKPDDLIRLSENEVYKELLSKFETDLGDIGTIATKFKEWKKSGGTPSPESLPKPKPGRDPHLP